MDREELDRQLKEQGKNIELQTDKFSSGRKKLAAAAVVLLITGFIGGCFFGDIIPETSRETKRNLLIPFHRQNRKKWRSCRQSEIRLLYRRSKRLVRLLLGSRRGFMIRIFLTAVWRWGRVSAPVLFLTRMDILLQIITSCQAAKKLTFLFPMGRLSPAK